MFEVYLDRIIENSEELQFQCGTLKLIPETANTVKASLSKLSYLDDQIGRLNKVIAELEEEQLTLLHMSQGMDKIIWIYQNCENRICDNSENNIIRYRKAEIQNIDLTEISAVLGGLVIE